MRTNREQMNNAKALLKNYSGLLLLVLLFAGCTDDSIIDVSKRIPDRNWNYNQKINIPVTIDNENQDYDLYLNLRHTSDYRYSNIFVLISESGKGIKRTTERKEFQLAYPDGEWLGSGSGNLYSYQLLFKKNYKFPAKGVYVFEFEENMRDNPLREISDVGLRIVPSAP